MVLLILKGHSVPPPSSGLELTPRLGLLCAALTWGPWFRLSPGEPGPWPQPSFPPDERSASCDQLCQPTPLFLSAPMGVALEDPPAFWGAPAPSSYQVEEEGQGFWRQMGPGFSLSHLTNSWYSPACFRSVE